MNQIEKIIDIATWNRKEHFEHFSAFDDPFFGVTVHVDCTRSYQEAKDKGVSFSLLLLHRIITAASKVEEFRYRIEGDKVVCYDSLIPEATVGRADHTFSFAAFEYDPDELTFIRKAKTEMERLQATTGLNKGGTFHPNAIHYSAVPWLAFTDMKHPTNMRSGDSVPKISTGKYFREGEKLMPYFTIGVGMGANVLSRGDMRGFYQILALKIAITRSSFLHIGYNLQNFQTPNYLMLGLGFRFHNKYPKVRH